MHGPTAGQNADPGSNDGGGKNAVIAYAKQNRTADAGQLEDVASNSTVTTVGAPTQ
jgi:hypothetical protein